MGPSDRPSPLTWSKNSFKRAREPCNLASCYDAWGFYGEAEAQRNARSPAAVGFRAMRAVEAGVDLDACKARAIAFKLRSLLGECFFRSARDGPASRAYPWDSRRFHARGASGDRLRANRRHGHVDVL